MELVERDYPELLNFTDEILHLDSASKVSVESIQKSLTQMDKSIRNLEMDLKNAARGPIEDNDRYSKAYSQHCIYENNRIFAKKMSKHVHFQFFIQFQIF